MVSCVVQLSASVGNIGFKHARESASLQMVASLSSKAAMKHTGCSTIKT
jgi:hypothetical protein